jgi:aminopeptidase 2
MCKSDSFLVVSLDIVNATKVVTFNAAVELNLGPATLVASSSSELAPVETKFDAGTQRATLIFAEDLPAGSKATLRVGFESALIDSMSGYYKSTWEKGTYALTQFEVCIASSYVCWMLDQASPVDSNIEVVVSESPETRRILEAVRR